MNASVETGGICEPASGAGEAVAPGERCAGAWENALRVAYLRPEMEAAAVGEGAPVTALASRVRRVHVVLLPATPEDGFPLAGLPNVIVHEAAAGLPFADGGLDAVFAEMSLLFGERPGLRLEELVRAVKPGGRLVLADRRGSSASGGGRDLVKRRLREAGLVNVLVAGAGLSDLVATGSRRVAGVTEAVRANYAGLAEGSGGCCGSPVGQPGCCSPTTSCCSPVQWVDGPTPLQLLEANLGGSVSYETGYGGEELSAVPGETASLVLGCGMPTALAGLRPGETVLDIGSGAGIDAFLAARAVGPTGRVIGLDMTPAMIERATRAARAAGLAQVEFRQGQAEAMPVESGTVDIILSNCVINLTDDKGLVFEEAFRVLRPGGRLSVSDMVTDGPLPMAVRGDSAQWAGCVHGALPEAEYLDLVRAAGFVEVEGRRTLSGGELAGVPVYSLSVTAHKG